MKKSTVLSVALTALAAVAAIQNEARAQYIGAGSTPEGDYLRGLGIAAWGMGQYNLNTAQAESINVDTFIRWNEYLAAVAKEQTREYVARKMADANERKEFYKVNRERILNSPESHDVLNGDALNRTLEELLNSNLGESAYRLDRLKVPIPVDLVRHIPFKLAEKNEQFSMVRLSLKGKGVWSVALQDTRFDYVKKRYGQALDKALEQAIDGRMQIAAIEEVEARADDLFRRLDEVVPPSSDRLYLEAKERLTELKSNVRLLKTEKIERAIGDIDKYSGTTVNDLKNFMMTHNLRFAAAKTVGERRAFSGAVRGTTRTARSHEGARKSVTRSTRERSRIWFAISWPPSWVACTWLARSGLSRARAGRTAKARRKRRQQPLRPSK